MNTSGSPTAPLTPRVADGRPDGPVALNRYRLQRRLGAGGFGTVWLARDERLERDVAVKILPRERIVGGRFEREARATARLSHPGIVTLYEAAVDDDGAYLVSELVRGATLAQLLEAGRLSDRDIVAIGIALCDALAHAHAQAVVHRDVKPSNVLVPDRASAGPAAKLTDFGVARVIGGDSLTRTGDVIGTAAYMAPEQAEGLQATASADLYSLALVLYEALTGVNPIGHRPAQRSRRLGVYLPPVRRYRRDLPRELGRGLDLALRPRPRERGSVEELRAALATAVDEVQDTPGVVGGAWPTGTWRGPERDEHARAGPEPEPVADPWPPTANEHEQATGVSGWPARALGGATAAGLAVWLALDVLVPSPIAPAVAGLVAGVAVAALPRTGWLVLVLAVAGSLATQGRAGAAVIVVLGGAIPVIVMFATPVRWPLAVLAPVLGAVGLAGAWPALAARASTAWQRAALALTGWIWLVLGAQLAGADLYVRAPPGTPPPPVWTPSLYETGNHVIAPLLRSGLLAPAVVWAAGAVVLPWITTGRRLSVQIVMVSAWSAALSSATVTVLASVHTAGSVEPQAAVLGALAGGIVALSPALIAHWREVRRPPDIGAGLA